MTYTGLLDNTYTRWRPTQSSTSNPVGAIEETWSKLTGLKGTFQVLSEAYEDVGAGEMITGRYKGFGEATADVQEHDVVQVTAGPGAGNFGYLEVQQAYVPRGHHLQLLLVETQKVPST